MSRCIACGRCDIEVPAPARAAGFRGMMGFMLSASRSMPEFGAAEAMLAPIDEACLQRMQARCPAGVPFGQVAGFVRGYEKRLRERTQLAAK